MSKVIKVIAGPNGSGKTTFAETFLSHSQDSFLNPDLIATGLGPSNFEKASFQAGRVLLSEIKSKVGKGNSFAFESTLSGLTYRKFFQDAKNQGYKIIIYFIFLDKISLNLSRIKKRVLMGGHHIPNAIVKRRQARCFDNFWSHYRVLADEWSILDNSSSKPRLVMNSKTFNKLPSVEQKKFAHNFIKGKA